MSRNRKTRKECPNCEGFGEYEEMINCGKPISECCGGCDKTVVCPACQGAGKLSPRVCEIVKRNMVANNWEFVNPFSVDPQNLKYVFQYMGYEQPEPTESESKDDAWNFLYD